MEIDFPYALSEPDARSRLEILGQYLVNRHGIKVTWLEEGRAQFSGKYLVVRIHGELTLKGGKAAFRGEDPGFLWRSRARDYIEKKLQQYLNPATKPADLPTS